MNRIAAIPARSWLLLIVALLAAQAAILLGMGRVPICACGYIKLWHGVTRSSENSQHIADWYTFSHVIHGFLFYFLFTTLLPRASLSLRLALAVALEGGWEILENTDFVINRYRTETAALDYFGDSVLNSVADTVTMMIGFLLAARLPVWSVMAAAMVMEVGTAYLIRDNLILNIVMLLYPLDAIRVWQAGA